VTVIVTGAAGFIGMHVAERLLDRGERVIGIDAFNAYYDPALKEARAARLARRRAFSLERMDVADAAALAGLVRGSGADAMVHLAAQSGVRYSLVNPLAYEANVAGHLAVLEACRHAPGLGNLVYASSSSVYGDRPLTDAGFSETDPVDRPASLYAATKRSCELMSGTYARLYAMGSSGLRFFTAYGPWGRPDMAYFSFTRQILAGEPIEIFGEGRMARDFTYIDDVVSGILGVLDRPPQPGEHRIFNVGGGRPVGLLDMISTLEGALGRKAAKILKPMQAGDVTATSANISALRALTGYAPETAISEGLERFAAWYRAYFG
jgi:UDP-glucuronate 4-epimerase